MATEPAAGLSRELLDEVLADYGPRDFAVRFWDGSTQGPTEGHSARFTLVLQHPGTVRSMFWPPNQTSLGEAYAYDDFDVEGDIQAFMNVIEHLRALHWGALKRLRFARRLLRLPRRQRPRSGRQAAQLSGTRHSPERDRQAIRYHYDLPADFYRLWLDRELVYSCAYFTHADQDLDTAQRNKLDYVCRKLRLKPGQRLLDIGCGFGALVRHAARHYGVEAVGITLSERQLEGARQRIRDEGLEGRCRVEPKDYRDLDEPGRYDALASIGMVEHVGDRVLPAYFNQAWKLLRPGGVFLNHGIALHAHVPMPRKPTFATRYVFPDGELRPISATLRVAEEAGFEVRDVESLREHYRRTLEHWVSRLEAHGDEARRLTDETTYRVWRLYMAGSADGFRRGKFNIYQALLSKPDRGASGLPLTRADWYPPTRNVSEG
jgi:cyclopropane-fatty-acyl-phospholipid synthase